MQKYKVFSNKRKKLTHLIIIIQIPINKPRQLVLVKQL